MTDNKEGCLSGYRVLDLADTKGVYCTKMLADAGAEVIKVEPPEGDATRRTPPFAHDEPHLEKSLYFLYRNINKFGVTLRIESDEGRSILKELARSADVLVETHPPGYMKKLGLGYSALRRINPRLVFASITEFGQSGPYKNWKGSPIVQFALSATMVSSGFTEGEPVNLPGQPAYDAGAMLAAMQIVAALYQRGDTGKGQYIDVSAYECSRLGMNPWMLPIYSYMPARVGRSVQNMYPVYPCKDGYVRVLAVTPWQWDGLLRVLGNPDVLQLPEWRDYLYRIGNAADLHALMVELTPKFTMQELMDAGHREGTPFGPIWDIAQFVESPQATARGFMRDVDHHAAGAFRSPGPPYRWSEAASEVWRPPPGLGEHNRKYYCGELGYTENDLSALRQAGVI